MSTFTAQIAKYGIDIQIVRPEMTKFKMFREYSKHGFLFWGNYILKYWINLNKVVATFEKQIFLSQTLSHRNVPYSRHDIANVLLSWR
jgi:hypothetical protein